MKTQDLITLKKFSTTLPVFEIFKNRFSPRFFSDKEVPNNDIKTIIEAGRYAPSAYNLQPWYFYIAKKNTVGYKKLSSLISDFNTWAKKAPVLILAVYEKSSSYGVNPYASYDLGQAVISLVYQAQILGYYCHQIAGFNKEKAKKIVKENQIPWVMIALGKIGNYEIAPKKIIEKDNHQRERKNKIYEII